MTGDWLEAPSGDTGLGILQNGTEVGGAAAVPKWMAARFLQVDCTDSVRFLRNCSVNRAPCPSESAAVLNCRAQQGLRLVGGNSRCAGRVEIEDRHGGSWGTVCDDSWDRSEGLVVCRQLGCGSAIETLEQAHFGQGNGPIFLDEMDCEGSEASLWDCPAQRSHDCGHKEDAGVVCSEHREFRLSGGWDRCAGRVEVFYQGAWGTVCNSNWFNEHADLLCHSLGCNISESRPFFQHTLQNMVSFLCSEYKGSLWDCQKFINDSKLCNQSEAAGVICEGSLGLMAVLPVTEEALPFTMRSGLVPGGDPHGNSDVSSSGSRSLLIACIVLAMILSGTLLVCGLAIFWTSRKHSMATRDRREANLSGQGTPVLLNHSLQASTLPPTERNDYGDSPAIAPIIHVPAAVPGPASGKESDSDYEDYDFSTKPPTALSTFYNSLRYRPIEDTVQQNTVQMETLQEDTTASKHWRKQGDTVSTSSEEDYGNSTPRAKQNYNNSFPYLGDSEVPSAPSNPSCTGIRPPSLGGFGYPAPSSEGQGHRGPDSSSASLEKGSEPEHLNNRLSAATLPTRVPALRKHWGQGHRGPDSSSASLEKGPEPEDLNNRLSAAALPMHIPAPRKHYTESIEDSSSTSSGEEDWYQNWKPPPRSPAPVNQQPSSGSPSLAVTSCPQEESSEFDYDDIVSNKS